MSKRTKVILALVAILAVALVLGVQEHNRQKDIQAQQIAESIKEQALEDTNWCEFRVPTDGGNSAMIEGVCDDPRWAGYEITARYYK